MSICTYPLLERKAFLVTEQIAAYILLQSDRLNGTVPEAVQAMIDAGRFDYAVREDIALLPEQYSDADAALEILQEQDKRVCFCTSFTGKADSLYVTGAEDSCRYYDDEAIVFIPWHWKKKKRRLEEKVVRKYRKFFRDVIPEDFDIAPFIVDISGTYDC